MRTICVPLILCLLMGCAPRQNQLDPQAPRASRYVLMADEIREAKVSSAYGALERLRPWLLTPLRGRVPLVYIDGFARTIDELRTIPADAVVEIRYVTGAEAARLPGAANAIVVTTLAHGSRRHGNSP